MKVLSINTGLSTRFGFDRLLSVLAEHFWILGHLFLERLVIADGDDAEAKVLQGTGVPMGQISRF